MRDDGLMRRLGAARPAAGEPVDHNALFERIVAEPGDPRLVEGRSSRLLGQRARRWTRARRRVLAGSMLGIAGVAAALVLALSGSAAPPAFAITRNGDGSGVVFIKNAQWLADVNRKLIAMGFHEQITIYLAAGPAAASARGPVACTPAPGADLSGPGLAVWLGTPVVGVDGGVKVITVVAAATYHLNRCVLTR
jgi:hypothetical protein